ncbi:hypothetical protein CEE37_05640 [candidate division LCP-89 bacterium B3_LCP]|uniref:Peptidase S8/S53 domain-containing protein n=1 Tax=candidate division LCP-89 bacterium B3_LCP TaxID=2012998 RepID=A0A532V1Q6_UNCL8|nr:MAG: hypothetical protein CEE37_05640 [candidate division LCP-89 bacterium B3_LCP]
MNNRRHLLLPVAIITVFFILQVSAISAPPPMTADLEWKGRIVVEFSEVLGDVTVEQLSGVSQIGVDDLDMLARQYNVYGIEKFFPFAEKPEDPRIRDLSRYFTLLFPEEIDLHEVVQAYAENSHIITADPYYIRTVDYTPNDPYFVSQWHISHVGAPAAFDYCQGSGDVIVGVVDSGTDTSHVDLRDNLWINPGEDLNGNGMIEPLEWNGVDDDYNGYTDDFWGWNTWLWNNNVQDAESHGSHCAGCATAVTDNGVGVSSLGFSAKIMTAKAGDGQFIYAGVQGISYCANNGADVITLSYGNSQFWGPENSAIQNAWGQGVVILGSAGNDNTSTLHYPSAYDNVIAVGATNSGDYKAYFSNYGYWVDLCAPGMGILSTVPGNTYASYQGTSMSCPVAAGLAALIWAAKPAWNNAQVSAHLINTCYNIDYLNPSYAGQLGSGRIDAANAISSLYPNLSYIEQTFDDASGGNGNGRPEPGETVDLLLTVANTSATMGAIGVEVTTTCSDPEITITDNNSNFGNIAASSSANNYGDPITFEVDPAFEPREVTFELTLTEAGMGLTIIEELTQMVGFPDIMVVGDDGGGNYTNWYEQDLTALGYSYEMWDVNSQGEIPLATMQGYPVVIWHTSNQSNPLSSTEQTTIESYLNGGGNLFLTGEDIDEQLTGTTFYSDVLHSSSLGSAGFFTLDGVPGDPISDGTDLILVGAGGAGNSNSPSEIAPVGDAETVYTYTTTSNAGGIRWNDAYSKLVYFAFNFEAVSGINSTPRDIVLENMFTWFDISSPPPPPPEMVVEIDYVSGSPVSAGGGTLYYSIWGENQGTTALDYDIWIDKIYENTDTTTLILREITNYQPGWQINRPDAWFPVPSGWPGGNYEFRIYSGWHPEYELWYTDAFPWVKSGAVDLDYDFEANLPLNAPDPFADIGITQVDYAVPTSFEVMGAYPNPFNPTTSISFALPVDAKVLLSVYDVSGRLVETLVDGCRDAGIHEVTFDASRLSSGIYLYRLKTGEYSITGKMVLMK